MAFLNGSGRTTLDTESSAQYTGITLFNNSLYISDSSRRYINFFEQTKYKHTVRIFKTDIPLFYILHNIFKRICGALFGLS